MSETPLRQQVLDAGVLIESDTLGLYHRSFYFESIVRGVETYVSRSGNVPKSRQYYFAPFMKKENLVLTDYVRSFPNLVGVLSSFQGTDSDLPELIARLDAGMEWEELFASNNIVTCSAACHSLYPLLAGREIPDEGITYEIQGTCFRHEPNNDIARMQSFRQHEFVFVGDADQAIQHRDNWLERGHQLMSSLGLDLEVVVANDPFFGRAGKMLVSGQRDKSLKFEILCPISSKNPGAIASGNFHEDHFGVNFDIHLANGKPAYSSCIGFGLERISLALLLAHGVSIKNWPKEIRDILSLTAEQ